MRQRRLSCWLGRPSELIELGAIVIRLLFLVRLYFGHVLVARRAKNALSVKLGLLLVVSIALVASLVHDLLCYVEVLLSCVSISELLKVRMLQSLARCDTIVRVVDQQFHDQILSFLRHIRNQIINVDALLGRKVELHVRSMLLKSVEQLLLWRSKDAVNFMNLIQFVQAWKKRAKAQDLVEYTARSP